MGERAETYYLFKDGQIVNTVQTTMTRSEVVAWYPQCEVRTEDECSMEQLEAYPYWSERP